MFHLKCSLLRGGKEYDLCSSLLPQQYYQAHVCTCVRTRTHKHMLVHACILVGYRAGFSVSSLYPDLTSLEACGTAQLILVNILSLLPDARYLLSPLLLTHLLFLGALLEARLIMSFLFKPFIIFLLPPE